MTCIFRRMMEIPRQLLSFSKEKIPQRILLIIKLIAIIVPYIINNDRLFKLQSYTRTNI